MINVIFRKQKKIVSLATMPERENSLKQVIQKLLPQVDCINVYLNNWQTIPKFLINSKINIVKSQDYKDLGASGKFFWADKISGYHFTCDDDILYPENYIENQIENIEKYNRKVIIGRSGGIMYDNLPDSLFIKDYFELIHYNIELQEDIFVHLLGTGILAYHTDTISVSLKDFPERNMVDMCFASVAQQQKIPMVIAKHPISFIHETRSFENSISRQMIKNKNNKFNTNLKQIELFKKNIPWILYK